MGELSDWAKKNSKTLILEDGETVQAVYEGYKITTNPFDVEKELAVYRLKINSLDGFQVKAFKSASGRAARFFDGLKLGTLVQITRHGKGSETKYEFSVVGNEAQSEKVAEGDENDVEF